MTFSTQSGHDGYSLYNPKTPDLNTLQYDSFLETLSWKEDLSDRCHSET